MATSYNRVSVPVDVQTAFTFVADFTNAAKWDPQAETVEKVTDGPIGQGTKFLLVTSNQAANWGALGRIFMLKMHMPYEIVAYDPPRSLTLQGRTSYLSYHEVITFTPTDTGCDVVWEAKAALHSFLWLGNPIFSMIYQKIADQATSGIAAALTP